LGLEKANAGLRIEDQVLAHDLGGGKHVSRCASLDSW